YSSDLSNMACFNDTKTMVNITNTNNWNQQLFCFPDPNGIDLSSFVPSKIIAILNNLIVVQDVSNYRIKFYDFDYNYVDSIEHYPLEWKQYEGEIPKYNCDPEIMVHIEKCWSIIENYSKIDLINTLNDSTLLVTWRNINTSNQIRKFTYYHDILKKIDNKWEIGRDYFLQFNDTTDCFTLNRLNIKANYYIKKGYLYIIKPFPINLVKKYHGKKYSDFEDEMNNFYIVNDLQYTCFIFKYMP
ncbi:MAG: hypothetical protein KDC52_14930, partial [Ignavibacteriae bacterium]|nr:hypothetical protein [Ignavibacteriota bacterium]